MQTQYLGLVPYSWLPQWRSAHGGRELQRLALVATPELEDLEPHILRELANAHAKGSLVALDSERAVALWRIAEAKGDANASHSLAISLIQGVGVGAKDRAGGSERLEALVSRGHALSQYSLAKLLADEAVDHDGVGGSNSLPAGSPPTKAAAASGAPASDPGGDPRLVRALDLYTAAAKGGVLPALHNVANMFAAGQGLPGGRPDEDTARRWYEAAAEMGDPLAMFTLATWASAGRGGALDEEAALHWNEEAAKAGVPRAQFNAGVARLAGRGCPGGAPDYARAREWFLLAAERGMAEAAVNLGEMHRLGLGAPAGRPQLAEARRWHERARTLGSGFAAELLEDERNFDEEHAGAK